MTDHAHDDHHRLGHVLPMSTLAKVLGALLLLTGLTVVTGKMDLYGFDLTVAMLIATTKAILVGLVFMHLKYDKSFHGFIFLCSILFVGVFLAYTLTDTQEYQNSIRAFHEHSIADQIGQGGAGATTPAPAENPGH